MNKTAALETLINTNKVGKSTYKDKYGRSVTRYTKYIKDDEGKITGTQHAVVVLLPKTYSDHIGSTERVYLVNDWGQPGNVTEGEGIFHLTNRIEAHQKAVRIILGLD